MKPNSGQFKKGHVMVRTAAHKKALSDALKRSWERGRGGLGFGKGSGTVRPVGARSFNRQGYVMVKVTLLGRWRLEHVVVMESYLGRSLKAGEVVHHIDGDRQNNALANLYLCSSRSHHNDVHRSQDKALRALLSTGRVRFAEGVYEAVL